LAISPTNATAAGYHRHNGTALELLDDYSASTRQQREFCAGIQNRASALDAAARQRTASRPRHHKKQRGLCFLELNTIQNFKHNPTVHVELVGNAPFTPSCSTTRSNSASIITRRLEKGPRCSSKPGESTDAPEVWNRVAREENDGNIPLIDKTRGAVPESRKAAYSAAAARPSHRCATSTHSQR
jgi:hypothetical protein